MTDFERELVNAFNRFFDEEKISGIAHRKKQHRFTSQLCDVLVDSPHDMFYIAIENKSVKTSSTNKLYFTQHFSNTDEGHQIDRISDFLDRSGREGYLAVELKRGRGKSRKAYMVPWKFVRNRFEGNDAGISIDELDQFPEILRSSENYSISEICQEMEI